MSLDVLIQSAIDEAQKVDDLAAVSAEAVCTALEETPLRVEIFERVRYEMDEVSIADIHQIMDALVEILRGDASGS